MSFNLEYSYFFFKGDGVNFLPGGWDSAVLGLGSDSGVDNTWIKDFLISQLSPECQEGEEKGKCQES